MAIESSSKEHGLLIVGETHIKDIVAAENMKNMLTQFPIRGIEGSSANIEYGINSGINYAIAVLLTRAGIGADSSTYDSAKTGYYFGFEREKKDFLMINQQRVATTDPNRLDPFRFLSKLDNQRVTNPITICLERSDELRLKIEKECPNLSQCPKRNYLLKDLRNYEMGRNIVKTVDVLPKNQDLLVIVGHQHVPYLATYLSCGKNNRAVVLSSPHQQLPKNYFVNSCQQVARQ